MIVNSVKKLVQYEFDSVQKSGDGGVLRVFNMDQIPFSVQRIFTVVADEGDVRGKHAHRQCNQLLTCVSGAIEVICDDGDQRKSFVLNEGNDGIWVVNGVWAEQKYMRDRSVLLVLCDQLYDEGDYIRDYHDFKQWKINNT